MRKDFLAGIFIFVIGIVSIALFFMNNYVLTAIILALLIIALAMWHTKEDIRFFLIGLIMGTAGDILGVHFGVWSYANPAISGIPLWLPFSWGLLSMLFRRISGEKKQHH